MSMIEDSRISSTLFCKDIRNKEFKKAFEKIFEMKIEDFLAGYEYDELDEFPVEMESRGIMIGFIAETNKTPPQIAYIDVDVHHYPQHIGCLVKTLPEDTSFVNSASLQEYLAPCENLRVYHFLYNREQTDRIIFQSEGLRYELSINEASAISRVRVCLAEIESDINMRTYYLFG